MVFEENSLRLPESVRFLKNEHLKDVHFLIIFSVSYNNVVGTKQIYFSSSFLWIRISDNIGSVVGSRQCYYRRYRYGKGEGESFPVSNICLDDVFTLKICWVCKKHT